MAPRGAGRVAATLLLVCASAWSAAACKSSDDGNGDTGAPVGAGGAGAMAGTGASGNGAAGNAAGGGGAELCTNEGELNLDCPQKQPITGACAPHGACCHRASNAQKEQALAPDAPLVLEYRLQYSVTANQPLTLSSDVIAGTAVARADQEQQSLLWRIESPRAAGAEVSGPGTMSIGQGRYNCDGTYSFFGDAAAPARALSSDVARWAVASLPTTTDVSKHGRERFHIAFADNDNRTPSYTPFLDTNTLAVEWELVTQGFDILTVDTEGAGRDCIGARGGSEWEGGGQFVIYAPIEPNSQDLIASLSQSICQLIAFGALPEGMKDKSCLNTPRCMPGSADCPWLKLPDSLCPVGAEQAMWGCHLGAEGNPNAETDYPAQLGCSATAPTGVLDPDADPSAPSGQCCDALGQSTSLPPCNAYRMVQSYVAAAAEITDAPVNEAQAACP
jgi:hypothetical protein